MLCSEREARVFEDVTLSAITGLRPTIINWHRPLSTYMKEFLSSDLRLTFFDEPIPHQARSDPTSGKFVRAPAFVVMEWSKE